LGVLLLGNALGELSRMVRKLDQPHPKATQWMQVCAKLRNLSRRVLRRLRGSSKRRQNRGNGADLRRISRSSLMQHGGDGHDFVGSGGVAVVIVQHASQALTALDGTRRSQMARLRADDPVRQTLAPDCRSRKAHFEAGSGGNQGVGGCSRKKVFGLSSDRVIGWRLRKGYREFSVRPFLLAQARLSNPFFYNREIGPLQFLQENGTYFVRLGEPILFSAPSPARPLTPLSVRNSATGRVFGTSASLRFGRIPA